VRDGPTLCAREIGNVEGQTLWPWACRAEAITLGQTAPEAIKRLTGGSLIEDAVSAETGLGRLANVARVRGLDVSHWIALPAVMVCPIPEKRPRQAWP
jgi:hypothetical protein